VVQTGKPLPSFVAEERRKAKLSPTLRRQPSAWCGLKGRSRQGSGASAIAARPCCRTSQFPDRRSGDLGRISASRWRTSPSPCSAAPRKVMIDKENTTIVNGAGKKGRHRSPRCADQGADSRKTTFGTTTGEKTAGASGQSSQAASPVIRVRRARPKSRLKERKDRVDERDACDPCRG